MSRPSFQFYTKDWRANSKLRRCSPAARGVWIDILCALHDADEYGVARYPLKELSSEVGASLAHVRELVDKGVLKGADGALDEPFVYVPRSGRKDGPPVTLIPAQGGPIWYSSRMVRDEYVSTHRGEGTRFGAPPKAAPIRAKGDGPSSSSSSATAVEDSEAIASAVGAPPAPVDVIFGRGVPLLTAAGVSDRNARSMLGLMRKTHGDEAVIAAVQRCAEERPLEPVAWLQSALKAGKANGNGNGKHGNDRISRQLETAALMTGARRRPQPEPETFDVDARVVP